MSEASIALNRFGLGARADEPAPANPKRWLAAQFDRYEVRPAPIADYPSVAAIATDLASYVADARMQARAELRSARPAGPRPPQPAAPRDDAARPPGKKAKPAGTTDRERFKGARQRARHEAQDYYVGAVTARVDIALRTPAPFVERMVHFWANHFAVSADKAQMIGLAGPLEFEAVRPHVLGKFGDMLHAVERHPAMLMYLDQVRSLGPNSVAAMRVERIRPDRRIGINENLAREILELHTLGVRTGYSQADVTEFARALTGWTVGGLANIRGTRATATSGDAGTFVFAPELHEPGTRTMLGQSWPQEGEAQAAAVLDLLARHPATAKHIATKLARHFAGDEPPPALTERLEAAFLRSGGDLPTLYRVLIDAPECWAPQPVKFRTPWEWSLAAFRALGSRELPPKALADLLNQLGQPVWRPGSPAGWDDVAASWAAPDALMRRVEAASRIGERSGATIDARQRAAQLFPGALSDSTTQAVARADSAGQALALMLVAPEFLRR